MLRFTKHGMCSIMLRRKCPGKEIVVKTKRQEQSSCLFVFVERAYTLI